MTLPVPAHLVDTMGSATASGVEAASHLLQEVSHAVGAAAASTSGRARRLMRATHHRKSNSTRNLVVFGAIAGAIAIGIMVQRRMFDRRKSGVPTPDDGNPSSPSASVTTPERNGTMASAQPDNIKGRIKEAAGDLTNNDDLKREGKADQAAGNVKDGLNKVKDKIEDGVDAIKDRVNKN